MKKQIRIAKWKAFKHSLLKEHQVAEYYEQSAIVILGKRIEFKKTYHHIGCNECGEVFYKKEKNGNRQK